MNDVTHVPIPPVSKGSLWGLWLGLLLLVALGAGLAWAGRFQGVVVTVLQPGQGPNPTPNDVVLMSYRGSLPDGKVFDQQSQAPVVLANTVPGFVRGVTQMQIGGRYLLKIPADQGYGDNPPRDPKTQQPVIPPGSDLVFEVTPMAAIPQQEFQKYMMAEEQKRAAGKGGGQQGAAPSPPPQ